MRQDDAAIETNQLAWLESMAANAREAQGWPILRTLRIESEVAQGGSGDSTARQRTA